MLLTQGKKLARRIDGHVPGSSRSGRVWKPEPRKGTMRHPRACLGGAMFPLRRRRNGRFAASARKSFLFKGGCLGWEHLSAMKHRPTESSSVVAKVFFETGLVTKHGPTGASPARGLHCLLHNSPLTRISHGLPSRGGASAVLARRRDRGPRRRTILYVGQAEGAQRSQGG